MMIRDYVLETIEEHAYPHYPFICCVGHERRDAGERAQYFWDCRQNKESVCIFQYTVAGCGEICINNKIYRQRPGDVFLIERPGPYRYYLPEDSAMWEFKFINLTFGAIPFWNTIINSFGHTLHLGDEHNAVMELLNDVLARSERSLTQIEVNGRAIYTVTPFESFLDNSLMAYRFLHALHKHLLHTGSTSANAESVQLCIEFIRRNYSRNITSQEIAQAGFISPYYLNKRFKEVVGDTPIQYLTKVRLKNAMALLQGTDASVEEIARRCGFQNANYFAKVCKKYVGVTPSAFRRRGTTVILP